MIGMKGFVLLAWLASTVAAFAPSTKSGAIANPRASFVVVDKESSAFVARSNGKPLHLQSKDDLNSVPASTGLTPQQQLASLAAAFMVVAATTTMDVPPAFAAAAPSAVTSTTAMSTEQKAVVSAKAALEKASAQFSTAQKQYDEALSVEKAAQAKLEAATKNARKAKADYIKLNDELVKAKGANTAALQGKVGEHRSAVMQLLRPCRFSSEIYKSQPCILPLQYHFRRTAKLKPRRHPVYR